MSCKASLAALRLYGYFCDIVVMMLLSENKYDDDDDDDDGYIPRWFTHPQMDTHPCINRV